MFNWLVLHWAILPPHSHLSSLAQTVFTVYQGTDMCSRRVEAAMIVNLSFFTLKALRFTI